MDVDATVGGRNCEECVIRTEDYVSCFAIVSLEALDQGYGSHDRRFYEAECEQEGSIDCTRTKIEKPDMTLLRPDFSLRE